MIPYLQIELRDKLVPGMPPIVFANENVRFDKVLAVSDYETETGPMKSVLYDEETGVFGIKRAGVYLVNWFVSQQTGLSHEGSNFAIVIDPESSDPKSIVGSGHVKISPSSAFAIITATEEEVALAAGKQFVLKNISSHDATLSERNQVKAGLSVFGLSSDLFKMGYGHWQASGWNKNDDPYQLDHEQAIKFNDSLLSPVGITAVDSEDGAGIRIGFDVFTLQQPGVYQVSWEIPIEASYYVEAIELALELNGATVFSRSYNPLPVGVITGTAIVKATAFNTKLRLVNYQPGDGDIIQIGNYANLAIHRIS